MVGESSALRDVALPFSTNTSTSLSAKLRVWSQERSTTKVAII
jgi:hypothetical protein